MQFKLWHKFALALMLTSALALFAALSISQQSFKRGFLEFLNSQENERINMLSERLIEAYKQEGGWWFIEGDPERWHRFMRDTFGEAERNKRPKLPKEHRKEEKRPKKGDESRNSRPPPRGDRPLMHVLLLDESEQLIMGRGEDISQFSSFPLQLNQKKIGTLLVKSINQFGSGAEKEFVARQSASFLSIAGIALLLSAMLAWLFGRRFAARFNPMSTMARQLTAGEFDTQLEVSSNDELGLLGNDLNKLSTTLEANRSSRQRWIADISHELRTPISVLQGELEALQDGVRPLNLTAVNSLQTEVARLTRLVEDLYQLSIADVGAISYTFETINLLESVTQELLCFESQLRDKNIAVTINCKDPQSTFIDADETRLSQLLKNLAQNSLRYTDSHGVLVITLTKITHDNKAFVRLNWADSAPGVPPEAIDHIFDRMSRVETSRNRETGGAGLGLAIVKETVKAHAGFITAKQAREGGCDIEVLFPLEGSK